MKSIALLSMLIAAVSAAQPTKLVRIVAIDKSTSTAGEPLDEVKRQLRKELHTHPPTAQSPVCFIAYDDVAERPQEFSQLAPALAYVDALEAGGGTVPAEALKAAIEIVEKRARSEDLTILWLHDGDEGNPQETDPQLTKLDALFSARGRQGLAQSVQLRTWSGGNDMATIAARLAANPSVQLVDPAAPISLAPIIPLSLRGDVVIENIRRGAKPAELILQFKPQITLHGPLPKDRSVAAYDFALQRAGVAKPLAWTVVPKAPPVTQHVTITATPAELDKGTLDLRFRITGSTKAARSAGPAAIVLPPPPEIVKSASIPGYPRPYEFAARLTVQGKPTWVDPAAHIAAFDAELKIGVRSRDAWVTRHPSITLHLLGTDGTTLISGPTNVSFNQLGIQTLKLKLKRPLTPVAKGAATTDRLRLKITGSSSHATTTFTPSQYIAGSGPLPLPATTDTRLKVQLDSTSTPLWYKPPNIAAFKLALRVTVDGVVPSGAEFIVSASSGTSILQIQPKKLRPGEQTIDVYVAAPLQPAPANNRLVFQIDPPPDTDTIHFLKPIPIEVDIQGPPTARLVATQNGQPTQTLFRTISHGESSVDVPAVFQLTGPVTRSYAKAVRAETRGKIVTSDLELYQVVSLPVSLAPLRAGSYLFDETHTVPFEVAPIPSGASVMPLRLDARVTQQAPFKQHLFLAISMMIAIAVPYFLARLAFSMRPPKHEDSLASKDDLLTAGI